MSLERAGDELGIRVESRERDFGRTPLMEAAHKGHWGAVAALLGACLSVLGDVLMKSWG
jgi:hypothetical protein